MPSYSAPDYVHLKQQNSNSTLTSNVESVNCQGGSHTGLTAPLQDNVLDDRVYLADDSVVIGDPIIVNFRDRKPWGACPCYDRIKLKKLILVSLLAFLIGFLCLALILVMMHSDKKGGNNQSSQSSTMKKIHVDTQSSDHEQVCTTASCVRAAASLLAAIDRTKDPCHNFFEYACGQWNKDHPIPDDMPAYGTFAHVRDIVKQQLRALLEEPSRNQSIPRPVKMAKMFYRSCMNTSYINRLRTKPIMPVLKQYGGWPLLNKTWSANDVDVSEMLGSLRKTYGLELFISLFVYADSKNTSANILTIDKGSLGLGVATRDYYLNDSIYGNQMKAYNKLIVDVITTFASDMGVDVTNETLAMAAQILDFERKLAEIMTPEDQRRNHSLMYNKWNIEELTEANNFLNWRRTFELIMPDTVYAVTKEESFKLIVSEPKYMKDLDDLLKNTDKKQLVNYVMWRFVKTWSKGLDSRFDDLYQDFVQVMMGRQQKPVRWKMCVPAAVSSFDMAAGALYVKEYFKQEDKNEALSMITYIQEAFRELVSDLDWMDNQTKVIAVQKASAMLNHIGYPEFIVNYTALIEYYAGLELSPQMTYFEMNKKITEWMQVKDIADLLKPFDRNKFDTSPAIVNAFYSPEKNAITFPAGILQPPFFKGDYPKSINFGAMGAVIGHEITHGFDDQGSQYDKNGNLKDWWSPAAFEGFRERTKCIIDQYGNYTVPDIKTKVNGKLTQGENIADNGGVKQAFKAYKQYIADLGHKEQRLPGLQDLSNEQLFFLSYANFWCGHKKPAASLQQVLTDPHSPEMFRVVGVLSNLDEFSTAFQCQQGSVMNPHPDIRPKCRVW